MSGGDDHTRGAWALSGVAVSPGPVHRGRGARRAGAIRFAVRACVRLCVRSCVRAYRSVHEHNSATATAVAGVVCSCAGVHFPNSIREISRVTSECNWIKLNAGGRACVPIAWLLTVLRDICAARYSDAPHALALV